MSTRSSLEQRLKAHAKANWPDLGGLKVRFRADFAYVDALLADGDTLPLFRLRYGGSATTWGFALYRFSNNKYEDSFLSNGTFAGTAEEALDCAGGLYQTNLADFEADLEDGTPPGDRD